MADPLFGPEIRQMFQDNDVEGMKAFCETLHPATVADALVEFPPAEIWRFLEPTNIRTQAAIFEYLPIDLQVALVEGTGRERMAKLIEQMSHDDRADLLRRLTPRVAENVLRLVDEADRRDIATLVKYPENSAGALMTTDYAWVPAGISVNEAIDRMRLQAPDKETIYYVYVLDEQRKLLGVVSLRDLILSNRHRLIRDIMETEILSVKATDDKEEVAKAMARYDLIAIPVVDDHDRLVGIVTHDDVIDVVVEEATEDVQRMGGVSPITENYLEASFFTLWRKRAIWLACLFGAELFTFTALANYEDAIKSIVVLSMFVPLCISTGGNSGSQAATIITRALALGQVAPAQWWRVFRHEIVMGIILGLTLGAIGYTRAVLTPNSVLRDEKKREAFILHVPKGETLFVGSDGVARAASAHVEFRVQQDLRQVVIHGPPGVQPVARRVGDETHYEFPAGCTLSYETVSRWDLALVSGRHLSLGNAGWCDAAAALPFAQS
jgi:magnesium transporter